MLSWWKHKILSKSRTILEVNRVYWWKIPLSNRYWSWLKWHVERRGSRFVQLSTRMFQMEELEMLATRTNYGILDKNHPNKLHQDRRPISFNLSWFPTSWYTSSPNRRCGYSCWQQFKAIKITTSIEFYLDNGKLSDPPSYVMRDLLMTSHVHLDHNGTSFVAAHN